MLNILFGWFGSQKIIKLIVQISLHFHLNFKIVAYLSYRALNMVEISDLIDKIQKSLQESFIQIRTLRCALTPLDYFEKFHNIAYLNCLFAIVLVVLVRSNFIQ